MIWTPRTTVAAIIERDRQFLLVEELAHGQRVLNQPAGHLEDGEGLIQAVMREVREETCLAFKPQGLVGIYRYRIPQGADAGLTYLRYCFFGTASALDPAPARDPDILDLIWLERAELARRVLRSPLVLRCIDDYRAGQRHSLELLHEPD
ncbi:MAG: NUDIX hydrolase [Gammaproteobacteria bacterium SHHR-1]|uniref:NUDIX hydrolase n=1 Tax=Magnetovirga frankeli TaxID=947516 RepID=UPI0012936832|nr:NUDIX hydrolase [gamma proteobacterium SS-5]